MNLYTKLSRIWNKETSPFLINNDKKVYFNQIKSKNPIIDKLKKGSVVALISGTIIAFKSIKFINIDILSKS